MKKNILYGVVFFVLVALAWFLVADNNKKTAKIDRKMFQVTDTLSIDRIFLADRSGKSVELVREKDYWRVKDGFRARPDAVNSLLQALGTMEIFSPVPKSGVESILKQLAISAKKVEVYVKGVKTKTLYIGGPTSNSEGTYVLLEGEDLPMIANIPGWQGYISPRFFTNKEDWRENIFASFSPDEITAIKVEHFQQPNLGFNIEASNLNDIQLSDIKGKSFPTTQEALRDYMKRFLAVRADAFEYNIPQRDSIIKTPELHRVTISLKSKGDYVINFYRVKYKGTPDDKVEDLEFTDPNRVWFYASKSNDFGAYQFGSTGNILLPINLFTKQTQ